MNIGRTPGERAVNGRVALYGHDTMGLGHLRRNLALSAALRAAGAREALVLTGAREVGRFPLPPGVDVLVLPGIAKRDDGTYRSRRLTAPVDDVVALRRDVLRSALTAFAPDLMVVDKVARGFRGELEPALRALRDRGTRLVLGLRDVLDAPAAATAEWRRLRTTEALREHYDEVWVYGDRRVSDLAADCAVPPSVRRLLTYTGFLAAGRPTADVPPPEGPFTLCLLGGGQDGAALAQAFARAPRPTGTTPVLVTGPHLPSTVADTLRAAHPGLCVVDFCEDPAAWARRAAAVVCMGGYNTVAELLATDVPVLVVPRVAPRAEQLVRARRLSERGAVDDLHPADLTPALLGAWLSEAARRPRTPRTGIDLDGMTRVGRLARAHLEEARRAG
ncbi:glycosyltransferase family protein [Pseudonocardia sp.]|uniref:glycosyltransferase family protein n=1 Tax=Pseudonocardia sp. TaxID=60912 RepID=UPI003D09C19D